MASSKVTTSENAYDVGSPVWIENPYPSNDPIESDQLVSIGPGPIDSDSKSKYREMWCPADRSERPCFVPAVVKRVDPESNTITYTTALNPPVDVEVKNGTADEVKCRDVASGEGYDDCLDIKHHNIAELIWNIQKRYTRDQIFSMCGPNAVVVVNPNKQIIPGQGTMGSQPWRRLTSELIISDRFVQTKRIDIFDTSVQRLYASHNSRNLPPHLYTVAKVAVDNVMRRKIKSQVIILSGIPGSGKTTCCKAILDYVVTASSAQGARRTGSSDYAENRFNMTGLRPQEKHLLAMNAILDSFGSCATSRNSKSSRLGKMIKIYFPSNANDESVDDAKIACTQIQVAMLDRARLLQYPMSLGEERNFNIFYEILAGHKDMQSLRSDDYANLLFGDKSGGAFEFHKDDQNVRGVDDKENFERLVEAFDIFGFSDDEQKAIFEIVIGILAFSKVEFMSFKPEDGGGDWSVVHEGTRPHLKMAAKMWGVTDDDLEEAVCAKIANDKTYVQVSKDYAETTKIMLMKSMYANLVHFIVDRMNRTMLKTAPPGFKLHEHNFLGVVDLFGVDKQVKGFNSLEQLMMNYTAERIQQTIIRKMFKDDEQLCKEEEVRFAHSQYEDNINRLDFFDKRATGLLTTLTTDTRFERVTDEASLKGFVRGRKTDPSLWRLPTPEFKDDDGDEEREEEKQLCRTSLVVKHFSKDEVRYNFSGFLKTNRHFYTFEHERGASIHETFSMSTNPIVRDGLADGMDLLGKRKGKWDFVSHYKRLLQDTILTRGVGGVTRRGGASLNAGFAGSAITDSSFFDLHYVFCVRPNMANSFTNHASPQLLRQQLESMCILDIIKHRHSGYAYMKEYMSFIQKFLPIVANNEFLCLTAASSKKGTLRALSHELLRVMLEMKGKYIEDYNDQFAEGKTRMFIKYGLISELLALRDAWDKKCHSSVLKIQHAWQLYLAKKNFQDMHRGVLQLQTAFRSSLTSRAWQKKEKMAKVIDNCMKNHFVRSYFTDRRLAAIKCQRYFRIKKQRMKWLRIRRGIRIMHSLARGFVVRQHVLRMLRSVRTIQRFMRASLVRHREYLAKTNCSLAVQRHFRGQQWRESHRDIVDYLDKQRRKRLKKEAADKISEVFKTVLVRRRYRHIREMAMLLQRWCRSMVVRNRFAKAREIAYHVQRLVKGFNARRGVEKMRSFNMVQDELYALKVVRERERAELRTQRDADDLSPASKTQRRAPKNPFSECYTTLDVDIRVNTFEFYPKGWARSMIDHEQIMRAKNAHTVQTCVGASHSATLNDRGEVYTWGWGDYGQLGHGDRKNKDLPACVDSLLGGGLLSRGIVVKQIACGEDHTVALSNTGKVYSWGSNLRGQLGIGDIGDRRALFSPTPVESLKRRVSQVKCGAFHTAALLSSGSLYTWGSGAQLGLGVYTGRGDRSVPVCVRKLVRFRLRGISCGASYNAAITHSGEVFTWGSGSSGQLGLGDKRDRFVPTQIEEFRADDRYSRATSLSCGGFHCVAVTPTGKLYAWGSSICEGKNAGCLGLGDTTEALRPCLVHAMKARRVVQVSCGWRSTIALCDDHRIFAWGMLGCLFNGDSEGNDFVQIPAVVPREIVTGPHRKAQFIDVSASHTMTSFGIVYRNAPDHSSPTSKALALAESDGRSTSLVVRNALVAMPPSITKHKAFHRIKRMIGEISKSRKIQIKIDRIDPNGGWMCLNCDNGNYKDWSMKHECVSRGLQVIRDNSFESKTNHVVFENVVVALVPVESMTAKQLRGVVEELQSPTKMREDGVDEPAKFAWRPPKSLSSERDSRESGWKRSTKSAWTNQSTSSSYTPKQYRSPPRRRPVSQSRVEAKSRRELLDIDEEADVRGFASPLSAHSNTRNTQNTKGSSSADVVQRLQSQKSLDADRRNRLEQTDRYVNWKSISGLFDDRHLIVSSDPSKQMLAGRVRNRASVIGGSAATTPADSSASSRKLRGVTVNDLIRRTSPEHPSKRQDLFSEEELVSHPEQRVRHSDALLRGNSAWSGLASVASMSEAEKGRILGSHHHVLPKSTPPPPPPTSTAPPAPGDSSALEEKVANLRAELASVRSGYADDGVPSKRVPTPTDDLSGSHSKEFMEVLEKIKQDAARDIESFYSNDGL